MANVKQRKTTRRTRNRDKAAPPEFSGGPFQYKHEGPTAQGGACVWCLADGRLCWSRKEEGSCVYCNHNRKSCEATWATCESPRVAGLQVEGGELTPLAVAGRSGKPKGDNFLLPGDPDEVVVDDEEEDELASALSDGEEKSPSESGGVDGGTGS